MGEGFVVAALVAQHAAQVEEGACITGLQAQGLPVGSLGLVQAIQGLVDRAQVIVERGDLGLAPDGLGDEHQSLFMIPPLVYEQSQQLRRMRVVRAVLEDAPVERLRLVQPLRLVMALGGLIGLCQLGFGHNGSPHDNASVVSSSSGLAQ